MNNTTETIKTVCKKDQCAGCMACVDICPTNSIHIKDSLCSMNAVINTKTCIECRQCYKVCQYNNPSELRKPMTWYQGWAADEIRVGSSSGGFGQELIRTFMQNDGIVAACKLVQGDFKFVLVKEAKEIDGIPGSKYVKSNPVGIYKKIKKQLAMGDKVLFIGLPCQVSSLRNYIGENSNLYTVDLICHGSPSTKLLRQSLKEYGYDLDSINEIFFRKNTRFGLETSIKKIVPESVQDRYTMAFLNGLDYTENCYSCRYAQINRVGDLTIGDSWGTEFNNELLNGISLILCQTSKGKELLDAMQFTLKPVNLDNAIANNKQLKHPSIKPKQRMIFFKNIYKGLGFNKAVMLSFPKKCIKQDIKGFLIKHNIIRGGYN